MWAVRGGEDCSVLVNRFKEVDEDTDLRFLKVMEWLRFGDGEWMVMSMVSAK